jgi:AmpD protein
VKIDLKTGLMDGIRHQPSLNCNDRPAETKIDMLVVHGISLPPAEFGSGAIEQFFCGRLDYAAHPYFQTLVDLKVSAHLLINRQGEITQFVPFQQRAWHAGESVFQGRFNCNDFSIGIELEGTDDIAYEKIQYQQLANVIKLLQNAYPEMVRERIVGHADIAPGRKTDPGAAFDWDYLDQLLALCALP